MTLAVRARREVGVVALCLAAVSCDGSGVPLASLASEMAAVECAVRSQCTGRPLDLPGLSCEAQTTARIANTVVAELSAAIARGTARYDGGAGRACISALRAAGCAGYQTLLPDACLEAFGGKGVANATCVSHFDCAADHFCAVGDVCPGTCQPRGATENAACDEDRACAPGWRCPEIGGRCVQPLPLGSACQLFARPCAFGSTCFSASIIGDGTCEPVIKTWSAAVGESCAILAGYFCAPGGTCPVFSAREGELPRCEAAAASGGACAFGVPDPCPANEYCEGDLLAGAGTCSSRFARGQACRSSRQCAGGDVCDGSVCVARQDVGGPCASETGCWSRVCREGVCVAPDVCAR